METILQEVNEFIKQFEEIKKSKAELLEFNTLLQEELRLARDAEQSAESKKTRCQAFLNQQQEVIQKLLSVKEENENLKWKLIQSERNLCMIQNNSIEEQMRKDARAQEIEQEYLKKIIKLQEDTDQQVEKLKFEYLATIDELKGSHQSQVSKLKDQLEEKEAVIMKKDAVIVSLQEEVQHLKEFSEANIETFHKKLAEQERKHQSEIETWRVAELNRTVFEQTQQNNSVKMYETNQNYQHHYQPSQIKGPMQEYQPNARFQEPVITYQKKPLVTHYKNVFPRHNTNIARPVCAPENYQNTNAPNNYQNTNPPKSYQNTNQPENYQNTSGPENFQNTNKFLSAKDVYMQSHMSVRSSREEKDENGAEGMKKNNKTILTQKPKILVPNKKRKLFNQNQNML